MIPRFWPQLNTALSLHQCLLDHQQLQSLWRFFGDPLDNLRKD